jgi:hypothetical protein
VLLLDFVEQEAADLRKEILVRPVYVFSDQATPFPDATAEFPAATAEASEP